MGAKCHPLATEERGLPPFFAIHPCFHREPLARETTSGGRAARRRASEGAAPKKRDKRSKSKGRRKSHGEAKAGRSKSAPRRPSAPASSHRRARHEAADSKARRAAAESHRGRSAPPVRPAAPAMEPKGHSSHHARKLLRTKKPKGILKPVASRRHSARSADGRPRSNGGPPSSTDDAIPRTVPQMQWEQREQHRGYRPDYALGDPVRDPSHVTSSPPPGDARRALAAIDALRPHDFAFLQRSDGSHSYAVLACRTLDPARGSAAPPNSANEVPEARGRMMEESLVFVVSNDGSTKKVRRRRAPEVVRLAVTEPASPNDVRENILACQYLAACRMICEEAARCRRGDRRGDRDGRGGGGGATSSHGGGKGGRSVRSWGKEPSVRSMGTVSFRDE